MPRIVRDTDRGYKRLLRRVFKSTPAITVGVHGDEGGAAKTDEDGNTSGLTVSDIATIHEFGIGNHPTRSFIRAWFDSSKSDNKAIIKSLARSVVRGTTTAAMAAERAALLLENSCKGFIQGGQVTPPTIKDGGNTTLIDTSQLVTSIRGKVETI